MTRPLRPTALLAALTLILALAGPPASGADRAFPESAAVVDVTRPPYNARGDGQADDTQAIQRALSDVMGKHRILDFPAGTYLVSDTLRWSKRDSEGREAWGFNRLRGRGPGRTVIRLKDATFTDPAEPRAVMWCGGFGSADWFHNYIEGMTFDTGRGNPGAVGLQFYSNNTGAVRDVRIASGDGRGVVGLDLAHRDMNGPLLVRNLVVEGFDVGVLAGHSVNSQTFEHVRLSGQGRAGLENRGQAVSIRGLVSENAVPAIRALGPTALLDARLVGRGGASDLPAIEVGGVPFFARDVVTGGYRVAIVAEGGGEVAGPAVNEYVRGEGSNPSGGPSRSLRLPAREAPEVPADDPEAWAVVDRFGADPTGQADSSDAIQRAIDSGASTVFFPGFYNLTKPVRIRGKVRRLAGTGAWIDYHGNSRPDFIVEDGEAPAVVIEHFAPINGGIAIRTDRTVILRSVEANILSEGKGDLFLEDVATHDLRINPGQKAWARQLNVENEGTHVTNRGGSLWILGYKTERGGTLLHTLEGGRSEVVGNFSYTTTAGKLAPMFVTEDSAVFAFFHEVCYTGDPFVTLVRDTRDGATQVVARGEGGLSPYVSIPPKP